MIVLDASVLIAHVDDQDHHHARAVTVLSDAGDQGLGASPLTLAEVLVGPARAGQVELAVSVLDQLRVEPIPLPADAPTRLALLRAATNLRLPDCCVLLAAQQVRGTLATFDQRLAAAAQQRGLALVES